jgi:hypothetical protein
MFKIILRVFSPSNLVYDKILMLIFGRNTHFEIKFGPFWIAGQSKLF